MKIIKKLLKSFFATIFVLLPSLGFAQYSLSQAISGMPTEPVPFNATKNTGFIRGHNYGVVNPNNIILDRLYDNVQLTEYVNASVSLDLAGETFRKFVIPGSNNTLLVVSFGGVTERNTDVMCVVNGLGEVLSTLEVAVMCYPYLAVKQFRINAQNQIIVTTIKPVSSTSIPLETFTNFSGYRQDITYSINAQGQFEQVSEQTYQTKIYTRSYLEDMNINLWEGNETPLVGVIR